MRSRLILAGLLMHFTQASAQQNFVFKSTLEAGLFQFSAGTVTVDPGPGWKGYDLPRNHKTGFQVRAMSGIVYRSWLHISAGAGYARYDAYNGMDLFGDIRMDLIQKRLMPLIYFRPGYAHFWNQYEHGSGTSMLDAGIGISYRMTPKTSLTLSGGLLLMQQSAYIPLSLGVSF